MKRNQNQEKRVKKLILTTGLFAVLLVASTYAWFIGMQTVSVNAFEVKIAAAKVLACHSSQSVIMPVLFSGSLEKWSAESVSSSLYP